MCNCLFLRGDPRKKAKIPPDKVSAGREESRELQENLLPSCLWHHYGSKPVLPKKRSCMVAIDCMIRDIPMLLLLQRNKERQNST